MSTQHKTPLPVGPPQGIPRDAGRTIARMSKMLRNGAYSVEALYSDPFTATITVKDVDGEQAKGNFLIIARIVYTGSLTVTPTAGALVSVGTASGEATYVGYTDANGQIVFTTGQASTNQITITAAVVGYAKASDTKTWS